MAIKAKISASTIKNFKIEDKRMNDTEIKGFHARISKSGNICYYFFYRHNGKQCNFLLGRHGNITPVQARDFARLKAGEVATGVDVQTEKREAIEETRRKKLSEFKTFVVDRYYPFLITNNVRTADQIKSVLLNTFEQFGESQLDEITPWAVEKWRKEKREEGCADATLNYYVSTLKGALSRAVDWGFLEAHQLGKVKAYKLDNSRVRYLNQEEEQALLNALRERDQELRDKRASGNEFRRVRHYELLDDLKDKRFADHIEPIVLIAMNTGMRRGEILSLEWKDVDFSLQQILVRGSKAKSGHRRYIPMNAVAVDTMKAWFRQRPSKQYVFVGRNDKPLTEIKRSWETVVEMAGLVDFHFHDLRHHFASKLVMKGVDLNTVRELLGHADLSMTIRYSHLAPEHKAAAVNLL